MTQSPPPPAPPPPPPAAPPPPPAVPPPPPDRPAAAGDYPVVVELDRDLAVHRWRPLVNWVLALPHYVIVYLLLIVERALLFVSFVLVLFTKRIPDGIFDFRVMTMRYQWRVSSFAMFMKNEYPPFSFELTPSDDRIDAARLSVERPGEMNRWLPLVKWLLAFPHYVVLVVLWIAAFFVWVVAFFAVIFTGRYPSGMRDFLVGVSRWSTHVIAYVGLLTDQYPPFSLS